jgi:hypothetical protein
MRLLSLPIVTLHLLQGSLTAQSAVPSVFLTRLGNDTVMLERFTLGRDRVDGTVVLLAPRVRIVQYGAMIAANGRITGIDVTNRPGVPGSQPTVRWQARLADTTITLINQRANGTTDTATFAVRQPSLPFLQLSLGLYQAAVNQIRGMSRDSVPFDMYSFGVRQPTATYIARRGRDTLAVGYFGDPMYVAVDAEGRIRGLNGMRTTQKFLAQPAPTLDFDAVTEQFVARERAGVVAGMPSPRDTARATLGSAEVWIDYGRPAKRGRRILGEVVPFDQVWRTGANAATQLTTSVDLRVGDATIPAGRYTLWTLPTAQGATLIVNRQTGQWGTQYDVAQDLVRVPLVRETLAESVERFTISVTSMGQGGELRFDWDRTRWRLPFTMR